MSTHQKEYYKQYCEKNRETLKQKRKEISRCEYCDIPITRANMYKHKRTAKHKLLVEKEERKKLQEEIEEIIAEIEI